MSALIDLTGERFGRLEVLGIAARRRAAIGLKVYWLCRCDCGVEKEIYGASLRNRITISCGCVQLEKVRQTWLVHGQTRRGHMTAEYQAWKHAKARCFNPTDKEWKNYGERGITVCSEWVASFEAFFECVGRKPSPAHSLDRIDNDGNYEPGNVRWATKSEQCANQRRWKRRGGGDGTVDNRSLSQ